MSRKADLIRSALQWGGALIGALLLLFASLSAGFAQDVTLTSRDGGIEVSGALIGYDGEFYRVRSEYGDLTLDGSGVICSGPGCPDLAAYVARVTMSGPAILTQDLLPRLIDAFARSESYVVDSDVGEGGVEYRLVSGEGGNIAARFVVETVTNAEAFAHLISGQADLVLATRAVLPDEDALAAEAGLGTLSGSQQSRVMALDAIVPVVSGRNPARRISVETLAEVFSGETQDWRDLTGVDAPIYLHLLAGDRPERVTFLEKVLLPVGRSYGGLITFHEDVDTLLDAVARDPFALGLARMSDSGATRRLELTGACGYARDADAEALKAEDYPLAAPLMMYQRGGRLPRIAREWLSFLGTPAAHVAISRAGLVDQGPVRTGLKRQGDRLANAIRFADGPEDMVLLQDMVDAMTDMSRLSMSFRFRGDGEHLDLQSLSNTRLLGRALESGTLGAEELLFVGFAGSNEEGDLIELSRARADEVEARVLNAAATLDLRRVTTRNVGYGDILPLACDDQPWGQHMNRRVEVWVR